eukprot:TRINITY_DN1120_c0_g1_i1.p1 TRINITY_DN1120_c0_g1~~TRINITY_DN1120_c0_g1_i1.p1  ORF type:complete len:338 (+),score=118.86 TRINITY_DN1120_c0_g1_i1:2-1015(+)
MNNFDVEYLKTAVGDALSKGIAATTVALPEDPVEYLGNWLLKYLENQKREGILKQEEVQLIEERRKHQEQLEWERLRQLEEARKKEEERLRIIQAAQAKEIAQYDTYIGYCNEKLHQAKLKAAAESGDSAIQKARKQVLYEKQQLAVSAEYLSKIEKSKVEALSQLPNPVSLNTAPLEDMIQRVVQAVLYILGLPHSQVRNWEDCKKSLHHPALLSTIVSYSPLSKQGTRRHMFVKRALKGVSKKEVIKMSFVAGIMMDWIEHCISLRLSAIDLRVARGGEGLGISWEVSELEWEGKKDETEDKIEFLEEEILAGDEEEEEEQEEENEQGEEGEDDD